jgi:hypothetical protein
MANNKKTKPCANCETLINEMAGLEQQIATLKAERKPKPYTLEIKDGVKSNAYLMAEIAGLVKNDESKTWENRKAYNAEFNTALLDPKVAVAMVKLYAKKGWDIATLDAKVKEAKEAKEKAYKVYKQKAEVYKNLQTTRKAVKKSGISDEQFKELCALLAPEKKAEKKAELKAVACSVDK